MNALQAPARFGAHDVVDALVEEGVNVFFANPGTSEIHLVSAIDQNERAHAVLCLFEGVATGAADGYARACGKPAAVLLHLGPGLANGLANLHNAFKARTPMVVLVGEHASAHLRHDSPLRSDLDSIAGYAAKQVFHMKPGDDLPGVIRAAVAASVAAPCGPVVVVANADVMWSPAPASPVQEPAVAAAKASTDQSPVPTQRKSFVAEVAAALRQGEAALVLGGAALAADSLALADSIAQATGCKLLCETFNARHERGAGVPTIERIPYFRELAVDKLAPYARLVLVGARPPVAFFGSPGERSELTQPGTALLQLPDEDSASDFLVQLADKLGATDAPRVAERNMSAAPSGMLVPKAIWAVLNRLLPAGTIVSDESGVTSVGADEAMRGAERHVWLNLTGGSIGQGLPVAAGAAVGCPDRTVIALHGDGGAMYTAQALWTQAREKSRVVNVIFRNDRYAILDHEVRRHGLPPLGPRGAAMFELSRPTLDWVQIAGGMGVPATNVTTAERFAEAFREALAVQGPSLIEVMLPAPRAVVAS